MHLTLREGDHYDERDDAKANSVTADHAVDHLHKRTRHKSSAAADCIRVATNKTLLPCKE